MDVKKYAKRMDETLRDQEIYKKMPGKMGKAKAKSLIRKQGNLTEVRKRKKPLLFD